MLFVKDRTTFRIWSVILLELVTFIHGFSQEQAPEFYIPAMPSPTVASMAKYADLPEIDQFGLVPITIPLYDVKLKDFDLPISLSYRAGGIRVSQESSWVGLGFDLTAVGFISRSVRDLPDDLEVERNLSTSPSTLVYKGWLKGPDYFQDFPNLSWAEGSNDEQRAAHVLSTIDGSPGTLTKRDGEPDVFYLNIGNVHEKFVFDHQGQVAFLEPDSKLRVTYSVDDYTKGIHEFIVVDNEGNKYYFGSESEDNTATEETTVSSEYLGTLTPYSSWLPGSMSFYWQDGGVETRRFRTTWFIRKIFVESCHKSIDFTYEPATQQFDVPLDQYYTKQDDSSDPENPKPILHMLWSGLRSIEHLTETKYLSGIATPDATIDFELSNRDDLQGAKRLDEIVVTSLSTSKVVEDFVFAYEVRQSEGEGTQYERKRMYLTSLVRAGMPAHKFYYSSVPMPDKRSYKQDLWGFPCAKSTSFIPRIYVYPNEVNHLRYSCFPIVGNTDFELLDGSDRTVDESSIFAGSLERIELPTGGALQIVLEPNDFYGPDWGEVTGGGLRIRQIKKLDEQGQVLHMKEYTYTSGTQSSGRLLNGLCFAIPTTYSIPNSRAIMYSEENTDPDDWDYFTLRKSSNYFPLVNHDGALVAYEKVSIIESGNGKVERQYYPAPNFRSHATPVKWASPYTRPPSFLHADGLGAYYVQNGDVVYIDLLDYGLSEESDRERIDVYELVDVSMWTSYGPAGPVSFYFRYGNTYEPLHITDYYPDHPSIYIRNDESQVEMGQVQKYGTNIFPFPPISDDGDANAGKLKEERYYSEGDLTDPIKTVSYTYAAVGTPVSIYGVVYAPDYVCNVVLTPLPTEKNWLISNNYNSQYFIQSNLHMYLMPKSWAKYHIIANQAYKIATETTIENDVSKTSHFLYNSNFMTQTLTEVISGDEIKVTSYKYADDYVYVDDANAINKMRDLNIVSRAIEKQVAIQQEGGARIILATLQSYVLTSDDLVVLDKVAYYNPTTIDLTPLSSNITAAGEFVPDPRYIDDFKFQKYDNRGNIRQYTNRDGIVTSFKWGYDSSVAVAKVVNAENNEYMVTSIVPSTGTSGITLGGAPGVTAMRQFTVDYTGTVKLKLGVSGSPQYSTVAHYSGITSGSVTLGTGACGSTTVTFSNVSPGSYTITIELTTPDTGVSSLGACGQIEYPKNNTVTELYGTTEFYCENFEESTESGVVEDEALARTGRKYFSGDYQVRFTRPNTRNYSIEYWYLDVNGKWQHINKPYTTNSMILSEGSGIDDIRICPTDAQMTTYTYDPLVGMTSMTDPNGITTFYKYDELGRLKLVKDSNGNVVETYTYHYKNDQ